MAHDYYSLLGVAKNASHDEIKKAFRKLAHQHHPDKKGGDEAKFKEINEAYQVLSDEKKRAQYDQFGPGFDQQGSAGPGAGGFRWQDFSGASSSGFGFEDMSDIFGNIFDFGGRQENARKGRSIHTSLSLSFAESVRGATKTITYTRSKQCTHCKGTGGEPGSSTRTCKNCGGEGKLHKSTSSLFGTFKTVVKCDECHGSGKVSEKHCSHCGGRKVTKEKEEISIRIPAGISDGEVLRVRNAGEEIGDEGETGDLLLSITVSHDSHFEREGMSLRVTHTIPYSLALLGGKVDVRTVDGSVSLKIPTSTQSGTVFRIRGEGVGDSSRGDMYVRIEVAVPTRLSSQEKKLIQELSELGH